jgi:polar amino acid transport system substrate-binding protein
MRFIKLFTLVLTVFLAGCAASEDKTVYQSVEDIRTARIGLVLGTTHDAYVAANFKDAQIIRMESEPDMFIAIQKDKCDVLFADFTSFIYAQNEYPNLIEVESDFPPDFYGMGFNKNNTALRDSFNDFLRGIKETGVYDQIYDRWIINGMESEMPKIDIPLDGAALRVAIPGTQYPFSFYKEQELVGFDIEIISRFAAATGRPIEFQSISFGSLIASVQAGKADVISAAMSITEERSRNIAFSDPYFETRTVVATIDKSVSIGGESGSKGFFEGIKDSFVSNIILENRYMLILEGLKTTIIISILSILLGTLLGALVCWMKMNRRKWLSGIADIYISVMRGTPVLVLLMLMFYVFLAKVNINGVYVAVLTFALNFAAYVSEMFRTAIQSVDRGQTEAGIALGFSPVQTFVNIIMPQAVQKVLPVYKGEMISLIKTTSIVGYIAVEDLTKVSDIIRSRTFDAFFPLLMVAILYFILSWLFGKALDLLNNKKARS